jgi:large subunit ribosomal protein L23
MSGSKVLRTLNRAYSLHFPSAVFKYVPSGKALGDNKHVFHVPLNFNKFQIKQYLESLYGLKVKGVNTMVYRGGKHRDPLQPRRHVRESDFKKAVVTTEQRFTHPAQTTGAATTPSS